MPGRELATGTVPCQPFLVAAGRRPPTPCSHGMSSPSGLQRLQLASSARGPAQTMLQHPELFSFLAFPPGDCDRPDLAPSLRQLPRPAKLSPPGLPSLPTTPVASAARSRGADTSSQAFPWALLRKGLCPRRRPGAGGCVPLMSPWPQGRRVPTPACPTHGTWVPWEGCLVARPWAVVTPELSGSWSHNCAP